MRASTLKQLVACVLACGLAGACQKDAPASSQDTGATQQGNNNGQANNGVEIPNPHPTDITAGEEVDAQVGVTPLVEPPSRARRRMDLDQLDATLRRATGGLGWTETRNGQEVNLFVDLAATLGKPDFIESTTEDLEPSALFLKFMDDAARSTCARLITRELAADPGDPMFLFIHAQPRDSLATQPDRVEKNLRALLMSFHGRHLDAGAPELQPWKWLMQSVEHTGGQPVDAWRAVCVALINHPDFFTY